MRFKGEKRDIFASVKYTKVRISGNSKKLKKTQKKFKKSVDKWKCV